MKSVIFAAVLIMTPIMTSGTQAQTIALSTSETLTYVGFTTSPLSNPGAGVDPVYPKAAALPLEIRNELGLKPDRSLLILDPQDQAYFWFNGDVEYDDLSLAVSDENGWYAFTREAGGAGDATCYSLDNYPVNSNEFTIHAFRGKRFDNDKTFTEFVAWTGADSSSAVEPTETDFPITIKSGDHRLKVHRVISGMPRLISSKRVNNLREEDYLEGEITQATPPELAYTGIVFELEHKADEATVRGKLDSLLGDGYMPDSVEWESHASVKDSNGTTWSTSFQGNSGGWDKISYMETYVNLPANQGVFTFDVYLTKKYEAGRIKPFTADATFRNLVIPVSGEHIDEITTTVEGKTLTIGMAGTRTDVPSVFSFGQFGGSASVYVSSPDPIPGLIVRITNDNGLDKENNMFRFPTSDLLHYVIVSFGSSENLKGSVSPETSVTVELHLPETLHFQFKAVPERPE